MIDVFVCPRLKMRLTELVTPLKPLESMAMGKALLASYVGGHREMVEDGVTGCLFTAENVDHFVTQSVRLAKDPELRARLSEAGRDFVVRERSWQNLVSRYLQIYEILLTARAKSIVNCD